MTRVVVVGAGMGGLAAAIRLARAGCEVEVVEAGPRPGGKAGIAEVDGVAFDTGPSVYTLPEILDAVAADAGVPRGEICELIPLEHAFRYLWPDGARLDVWRDPAATAAEVRRAFGADAEREWVSFLSYARRIWENAAPWFVLARAPTVASVASLGLGGLTAVTRIDAFRSMEAAVRAQVREPHLRDVLLRFATYNGSDPRHAPATLHCIAHVEMGLGSFGVRGGMYELPAGLARVGEAVGVRFRYRTPVAKVRAEAGRVSGVELQDGEFIASDAVVVNADVAHLVEDLLPPSVDAGIGRGGARSTSGWTAVLRVRGGSLPPHTALFPRVYTREFEDLFDRRQPPLEPTVYLCDQQAAHGRPAWSEGRPVFVMANAPAEPPEGAPPERWEILRETVLRRLVEAGLVESPEVVWERTPAGLAAAFPGSRGALYGAASNSMLAAFQRPPNVAPRLRGLYLASGSAHPGGGVPLCLQSGRLAAEGLLETYRGVS